MKKSIAEVLIEKLTPEELSDLCDAFDDGTLENIFYTTLLPTDYERYPGKYSEMCNDPEVEQHD